MKSYFSLIAICAFGLCDSSRAVAGTLFDVNPTRSVYNFNPGWKLLVGDPDGAARPEYDDSAWHPVTLPHAWNEDSAMKVDNHDMPTGIAWYRKHFKLPEEAVGEKVFLEFQGIRQAGEIYVNGQWIGRHENGVMAFGFDITAEVKAPPEENVIAVRTDNGFRYREKATGSGFEWNDGNFYANYGGINQGVLLHITGRLHQTLPLYSNLHTTGVYVYAQDFDIPGRSATVTAESQVMNECAGPKTFSYETRITGPDGKLVKTIDGGETTIGAGETRTVRASARVSNLHFWSWGYGFLYDVATTLKVDGKPVDTVVTRTGFRKTEFDHGMVKLNDRVIHLKGYAQRSTDEWPGVGCSVPPWMADFTEGMMVEGNASLVRWMHVTPAKQNVEACDRVGLMESMPAGDAEKDVEGRRWEQRLELMRDAIIYNRNNPSIIFYESGNNEISEAHMAQMKAVRDQYDPHGGRAIGSRNMLDSKVAEYGGEMLYINKSAGKPMWMMEYERDEGLRKYWDNWTPPYHKDGDGPPAPKGESGAPYNRNQDSFAIENVVRWHDYWDQRPGTGERVNAGGVQIYFSSSQTACRGAANYRNSGGVDAVRLPKDGFYANQVMWNGWVNPEPGIHIIGHWNYAPGVIKPVYVVSSADKVELVINGQSKGFGQRSSHFLFTWEKIHFEPGAIKAVGFDSDGKELCETSIETAGEPVALKLTAHTGPGGLRADGADMALVDVEVVDANGNRCPTAMNLVQFDLEGPAEWRGGIAVGDANAQKHITNNYILSKALPVECGINRILIRSQPQYGKITLVANSEGLKPATIELDSRPFLADGGLAGTLPDAGLFGRLERGPTPAGNSVVATRKNIRIVNATAGSNADQVGKAFDDDEASSWESDGKPSSAWIQFQLAHPGRLSQLVMKLGGWRYKSYPLRVTVDGKVAWEGSTPRSLGYVTLPLCNLWGQVVRVELLGPIESHDAFGMKELGNGPQGSSFFPKNGNRTLQVVEAEIYEPVTDGS